MRRRLRIAIAGAVQGVGFRPFVYRVACALGLDGWVRNDSRGVLIEVEGDESSLARLADEIAADAPPRASIQSTRLEWLEPKGLSGFSISASEPGGPKTVLVLPDIATCPACLADVGSPANRRHGYPFTNCTNCGPRFTIIERLPYDRPSTTMARFRMCAECGREYEDPTDRRFHAQPNACPACGPRLSLWSKTGRVLARDDEALIAAAQSLAGGHILALKGLGGFHLMVDATSPEAVARLRERKVRPKKPLALMLHDLAEARALCDVDEASAKALCDPAAPILLLRRREPSPVASNVAPGNPYLGVMLPYTPLHHLLLGEVAFPLVATSGNLTDEPICFDEREALERLGGIADVFLVHDRPIVRPIDDSVAWALDGALRLVRRARGFAPLPVTMSRALPSILAVGGELKNTVALSVGDHVFVSQHIGDLEALETRQAFERAIADLLALYESKPVAIAHDLHPDYASTQWARSQNGTPCIGVQHHHAHLAACLADNRVEGRALGIVWDGTGYGPDGVIWGGEFLLGDARSVERVAHLLPFRLPGGETAVREPRRAAVSLLWQVLGDEAFEHTELAAVGSFTSAERDLLKRLLATGEHAPWTTSAGRLFDAVAAIAGLCERASFEAEAAMALEFASDAAATDAYPLPLGPDGSSARVLDWRPLVRALVDDVERGVGASLIGARFHNALIQAMLGVARAVGEKRVALSGGCFQNRLLMQRAREALLSAGFDVLLHRQVPPNDGGLALGQVMVAAARL